VERRSSSTARAYSQDWLLARQITDRIIPVSSPQEARCSCWPTANTTAPIIERLSALNLMQVHFKIDTIVMAGPPLVCAPYAFAVQKRG
jgi:hypothetical protein